MIAIGTMLVESPAEARWIVDAAIAEWLPIDTATLYGEGQVVCWLGQALADRYAPVIAKVAYRRVAPGAMAETLRCRESLGHCLGTIMLHHPRDLDPTDAAAILAACEEYAGSAGLSNAPAWYCAEVDRLCRLDAIEVQYSPLKREAETELLPWAQAHDVSVYAYSPMASGVLADPALASGEHLSHRYQRRYRSTLAWAVAWHALARDVAIHPATLAVAWVAAHPAQPTPIVGVRTPEHLALALAARDVQMTPELYARIAATMPRPQSATGRDEE